MKRTTSHGIFGFVLLVTRLMQADQTPLLEALLIFKKGKRR